MAAIVVVSPAAMLEKLIAASAPQAGHFFLFGQEKVTKKKAAPEPPIPVPCRMHKCREAHGCARAAASRLIRARAELAERVSK
jgi:hypothetical protein